MQMLVKRDPEIQRIDRQVWKIVLPAILENLLSFAVGLVTTAMIGRMMADDISAQGIGLRVTSLITAFFRGLGVGATVVVGVRYGKGQLVQCRRVIEHMMIVVGILSTLCAVAALCFPRFFAGLFTTDEALMENIIRYLKVAVWMCPFVALSRMVTAAFNGQGDTRTPLYIATMTNIINAALGYALIFGKFGFPQMGLAGASWSILISNSCCLAAGMWALYRRGGLYRGLPKRENFFRADWEGIREVFTTGIPASVENMIYSFAAMAISRALLSYGTNSYAAYQLASQCEEVLCAPVFGFEIAATALAAQCVGRNDHHELRRYYQRINVLAILVSIPCMLVMMLLPNGIMAMLTDKAQLREIGSLYLFCVALCYIPQILNMIAFGTLRAMGHKLIATIGSLSGLWCVRIPIALFAAFVIHGSIILIFIGMAADQIYRYVLAVCFMKKKHLLQRSEV